MAALTLQAFPGYTPQQTANYLKSNASPRGAVPNNTWGYGFAKMPDPPDGPPGTYAHGNPGHACAYADGNPGHAFANTVGYARYTGKRRLLQSNKQRRQSRVTECVKTAQSPVGETTHSGRRKRPIPTLAISPR